jgi:hypothetical protein
MRSWYPTDQDSLAPIDGWLKLVDLVARVPLMPAFDPIFDRIAARLTKLTNARLSPDHRLFKTPPHLLPQERSHPTGDFVGRPPASASSETISPPAADSRSAAPRRPQVREDI